MFMGIYETFSSDDGILRLRVISGRDDFLFEGCFLVQQSLLTIQTPFLPGERVDIFLYGPSSSRAVPRSVYAVSSLAIVKTFYFYGKYLVPDEAVPADWFKDGF